MFPIGALNHNLLNSVLSAPFFQDIYSGMKATDLKVRGNYYYFDLTLPGYNREDINVQFSKGRLRISAKKCQSTSPNNLCRMYGQFSREFFIGDNLRPEDIKATYNNGVLRVAFPRKDDKYLKGRFIELE